MLDLSFVNWRHDRITERYIEENRDLLADPGKMTPAELGCAVTYCRSIDCDNPYADEIMRRSGHLKAFREAYDDRERRKIFDKACRYHGMIVY